MKLQAKTDSESQIVLLRDKERLLGPIVDELVDFAWQDKSGPICWHEMTWIAQQFGVALVKTAPLSISGLTTPLTQGANGGPKAILVNSAEPIVRQRYTLAHEIGHCLLAPRHETAIWNRTARGADDKTRNAIEAFCDRIAARILMPKEALKADLDMTKVTAPFLLQLARKYGVAVQSLAIRVTEIANFASSISEWQSTKHGSKRKWLAASRGLKQLLPDELKPDSPLAQVLEKSYAQESAEGIVTIGGKASKELIVTAARIKRMQGPTTLLVAIPNT